MDDPLRELEHLSKLASADPSKRFGNLYRLVSHWRLLHSGRRTSAAEHWWANGWNRRSNADEHIDMNMLFRLAEELAHNRYQPQAVRRVYIPKGKTGRRAFRNSVYSRMDTYKQRWLRSWRQSTNQSSVMCSYGFRPKRNTIQAIRHVAQAYQAGATWIIEGDLVKCFDSIPHGVILQLPTQTHQG